MTDSTESETRRWWSRSWVWVAAVVVVVALALLAWRLSASAESSATPGDSATTPTSSPAAEPGPTKTTTDAPDPVEALPPTGVTIDEFGREHLDPVPFDAAPSPREGITVKVDGIEAVDGQYLVPGEVAGPALRVTLTVSNDTDAAQSLSLLVVNLYYGESGVPAGTLTEPGGRALTGEIAPHSSATGVYLFNTPEDQRQIVRVEVDLETQARVVLFEGSAP